MKAFKRTVPEMERLARMYNSDLDAARAAGVAPNVLVKSFKAAGIESPSQRRARRRREAKQGQTAMPDYNYPLAYKD